MRCVFIGRFQPFHKGHFYALKKIAENCEDVFVIIGSADKGFTKDNPFTLAERIKMVKMVAKESGIDVRILPVADVQSDDLWLENILKKIKKIDVVFSNNGWVKKIFERAGYSVKNTGMYKRDVCEGTHIRKLMAEGKDWQRYVPFPVAEYIKRIKGEERVKKLFE